MLAASLLLSSPAAAQDAEGPEVEASSPEVETPSPDVSAPARARPMSGEQIEDLKAAVGTPEPEPDSEIEEIVVTGSRTESLMEVPISSTTFSASDIQDLRIQNIADLSDYTPNLEINTAFAASNPTIFIRGIGLKDYNANSAGAVAVYQDGISINSPVGQLFQMFDVQSVEVLRGPQGSLNGRNATAGAILVNSFVPDGEWSVNGTFTYGNYNTFELEGAVGFPIVDDVLSGRVAFTFNRADGFTRNGCAGWDPAAQGFDVVSQETIRAAYDEAIANNDQDRLDKNFFTDRNADLDPDGLCVIQAPGRIVTPNGEVAVDSKTGEPLNLGMAGDWKAFNGVATLEDFAGLKKYTNNTDNWAARNLLRFQPTDTQDWVLNLHGGQNRSDSRHNQMIGARPKVSPDKPWDLVQAPNTAPWSNNRTEESIDVDGLLKTDTGGQGQAGGDHFTGWYDRDGLESIDLAGGSLTGHMQFGDLLVTSISGGEWNNRLTEDEGDACPCVLLEADWGDTTWQASQEIRAERQGENYWWVGGFYGIYEHLQSENVFPNSLDFVWTQSYDQTLLALAPFAHGRYDFTESLLGLGVPYGLAQWSLEGGVRYNYEHKEFTLSSIVQAPNGNETASIPEETEEGTWTGFTGDVTISMVPAENMNTYVKYSRGMKGGHFNAGLTIQAARCEEVPCRDEDGNILPVQPSQSLAAVEPEFIDAVEIGLKGRWFDGRLQGSVALFRYWYKDLQVFDIVNEAGKIPTQQLLNADADVLGVELELQASPFPGLFVQTGVGWLDSEFVDFTVQKRTVAPTPRNTDGTVATFDYSGNPLIAAPEWSWSGVVEYKLPFFEEYGSVIPSFDWSYRSQTFLDPQAIDIISQPAYWLFNARLAYRTPDQRIEVAAWVRNFLNQEYKVDVFDLSREYRTVLEVWNDPRTFGITISYAW